MTLGREHSLPQGTEAQVFTASMLQWPDGKRQRPQRPQQQQQTIDLASQSSLELCSSTPAVAAGPNRLVAQQDFSQTPTAAVDAHARVGAAAAGQKRLWGEMAADDVTLVGSLGPSSMWGSTRPRGRRARPAAEPAAAAVGSPIVILDEDSPATLSSSMKQQLHLQASQHQERNSNRRIITPLRPNNPTSSPPMRPVSISVNPSIVTMRQGSMGTGSAQAAAGAVAPPVRRRAVARRVHAGPMAAAAAGGQGGQRRNSNSSSSSDEVVDLDADAALARKLVQEEEDRLLAQRLMEEEEAAEQARLRANRYELEAMQAAVGAAASAATRAGSTAGRGSYRPTTHQAPAPPYMPIMPPGYEAADTARLQRQPENLPVGGAASTQQQQQQTQPQMVRTFDFGQAMAHMLLSMPMPRASGRPSGMTAARRGLPASFVQMREAVLGMQRAGLPPHLLFSDRDFTADDYDLLCRLDETVENRKGAAATTIEALPTQTVPAGGLSGAAGERLSCAVCLEEFTEGAELRSLPCLHRFHKGCIDTWLRQKASCPVCNRDCT